MAAPTGTKWGSIVGGYGKIGIYVSQTVTNSKVDTAVEIWFASKYSVSDSSNTLYYDIGASVTSATSSRGSVTLKTTVDTGSGWSASNEKKIKTYTYSNDRSTAVITKNVYASLKDIDRVGGTMYVNTSFTIPALPSYTVTYNLNNGTGTFNNQTKYYGKTLTLHSAKPTRNGYSFQGWSADNNSSVEYSAGGSYTANSGATLYAVWKANTYSVKFDANGGTGAPSAQTKTYGVNLKLSTTKPTRTNYNFLGWSTSKTATSATYFAGGNYAVNSGTTLYAVWELAYVRPRITGLSGARCSVTDDGITVSEEGTNALISFDYECDQALSSIVIAWESVLNSGSVNADVSEQSGHISLAVGENSLSTDVTYMIRITVTDANGYNSVTTTLNGLLLAIDVLPENKGISFGKPAELEDHADFNYTIYPRKGFKNVPIEEDTDLNTLLTPNTYVSEDKVASTYINCPVTGGTFKMDVSSGGMEGQVHQTLTYTSKTDFKIYERHYYGGDWPKDSNGKYIWKCVYAVAGNVLWDGGTTGMFMSADQSFTLSQPISEQPHGISLIFSRYDATNGEARNEQLVDYTVAKRTVSLLSGSGHSIPIFTPWGNSVKYLYIYDTQITGNVNNNKETLTVDGITYSNKNYVLRYVIGF